MRGDDPAYDPFADDDYHPDESGDLVDVPAVFMDAEEALPEAGDEVKTPDVEDIAE